MIPHAKRLESAAAEKEARKLAREYKALELARCVVLEDIRNEDRKMYMRHLTRENKRLRAACEKYKLQSATERHKSNKILEGSMSVLQTAHGALELAREIR